MPRYYFHISSSDTFVRDEIGVEFDRLDQVEPEAIKGAREILAEYLKAGRPVDHQQFEIRDQAGALVLTLRFRDVMTVPDVVGAMRTPDVPTCTAGEI